LLRFQDHYGAVARPFQPPEEYVTKLTGQSTKCLEMVVYGYATGTRTYGNFIGGATRHPRCEDGIFRAEYLMEQTVVSEPIELDAKDLHIRPMLKVLEREEFVLH